MRYKKLNILPITGQRAIIFLSLQCALFVLLIDLGFFFCSALYLLQVIFIQGGLHALHKSYFSVLLADSAKNLHTKGKTLR